MAQEILAGPERRRRWSDGQKIAILVEAAARETTVTEVARRHGITRQHIYQWRSDMRRGRLVDESGGPFLCVEFMAPAGGDGDAIPPDSEAPGAPDCAGLIEITLRQGRVLRTPASIAPARLTALIRAAEAA